MELLLLIGLLLALVLAANLALTVLFIAGIVGVVRGRPWGWPLVVTTGSLLLLGSFVSRLTNRWHVAPVTYRQ